MFTQEALFTIKQLAQSQGFYSRLYRDLMELSEEDREEYLKQFKNCKEPVDLVLMIEQ